MKNQQVRLWFKRNFIAFIKFLLKFLTAIFLFLATIVIITTIFELFSIEFEWSFKGYHYWLSIINSNISILGITIALITIILIFKQINLAIEANKNSAFEKWNDNKLSEFEEYRINTHIYNHFKNNMNKIYDFLYELDEAFIVNRKKELERFFALFLENKIEFFETTSAKFKVINGYHEIKSYSINDVKKFTEKILKPSPHYPDFYENFDSLYNAKIKTMIVEKDLKK